MKNKRFLAMLLAVGMLATSLTGCGNTDEGKESSASDNKVAEKTSEVEQSSEEVESSEEEDDPYAEHVEIRLAGYYGDLGAAAEDNPTEQYIEERFNMTIHSVQGFNYSNFDTIAYSGELGEWVDCFIAINTYDDKAKTTDLYEQGVLRSIPEEYLWEYYPNGMARLQEVLGEDVFENGYHLVNGEVIYVPGGGAGPYSGASCMFYRADWLENLGMEVPTTLSEFHDMLYAFTYNDPDGNGKDDTWGAAPHQYDSPCFPLFGQYGFRNPEAYVLNEDGTMQFNAAREEYREAMITMSEWIKEGIFHPETAAYGRAEAEGLWADNKIGVLFSWPYIGFEYRGSSSVIYTVESQHGEGAVQMMPPLTTDDGQEIVSSITMGNPWYSKSLLFAAEATDEQVIRMLQFLDEQVTDIDLAIRLKYGEEGVDYTIQDGLIIVNDNVTTGYAREKGIGGPDGYWYLFAPETDEFYGLTKTERDMELLEVASSWPMCYGWDNFILPEVSQVHAEKSGEVTKVYREFWDSVMFGTIDPEEEWDEYLAKLEAAGYQEIIDDYLRILNK